MQNDSTALQRAARAFLWAGPIATGIGFAIYRMWEQIALRVDFILLAIVIAVALLAVLTRCLLRWSLTTCIAAIWLALLVVFAGPLSVLATALLALAALGVGTMLPTSFDVPLQRVAVALLAGLALIAGLIGWLLPLPIHRIWVYLPALLALAIWRRTAIADALAPLPQAWRVGVAQSPRSAAFALLALGLAATPCWLPTMSYDDLYHHLAVPSQLQQFGYYQMDVAKNVWALEPWAGDVLQAVVQMFAGSDAHGAVNFLWLILTAALLWELCSALELAGWARWLLLALYASQPQTGMLAAGMQTEGPATAVTLALALLVQRASTQPDARTLRLAGILSGLLLGLKVLHVVAIPPLLLWLLWRWRWRLPWRALPGAIALALLVGGSSYAYAGVLTGNPFLPLFNEWFRSPAFSTAPYTDARWLSGMHWNMPWRMTFATQVYGEYYAGAAGFCLVAMGSAALLALRNPRTRALILVALFVIVLPLSQMQHLRYIQPGVVLMLPVLVAATAAYAPRRAAIALLAALCCLNLAFQTSSHWMFKLGDLEYRIVHGDAATITLFVPERRIAAYLLARPNSGNALFTGYPLIMELAGRARSTTWIDPTMHAMSEAADKDPSGVAWRAGFASSGVRWVETTPSQASPALKAALVSAQRVLVVGDTDLWRLPPR